MKKKQPKTLDKMSTKEVLNELLFKSHFFSEIPCRCRVESLTHFMGMLPDKLCEQDIQDVDLSKVPDFESDVSSLCSCQRSHFFRIKLNKGEVTFEETSGKMMDNRKLRLPNF